MDPIAVQHTLLFLLFIILSAFFLGIKSAFFSFNNSTLQQFEESEQYSEKLIFKLLENPRKLLLTSIIGNVLFQFLAIWELLELNRTVFQPDSLFAPASLILTILVFLIFQIGIAELLSKYAAERNPKQFAGLTVIPLQIFFYLFAPLTFIFGYFSKFIASMLGYDKDKYELSDNELRTIVDISEDGVVLKKDEREMIHGIFEMGETVAREIMVPRIDMVCIDENVTMSQLLKINKIHNHSRIPVYKESIDNIVGILHIKDLLPLMKKRSYADFDVMKLINPVQYVPEQKKLNELLRQFRAERIHMAIVVDEYGGTAGIVTLEDVIEEIVGEIQDEYDEEAPPFVEINPGSYRVSGSMLIDDLNEALDLDIPEEDGIDTIAGFLLGQFGSVPKSKNTIKYNGYQFIIERVFRRRIEGVLIKKIEQGTPESAAS